MAHRTRLETLFEGDDTPVVHYKPRSLPSRPTNTKQFPSLSNHYHTVHGLHNYSITTILEDPLPASAKYLDLPQQQLQQYHARGITTTSSTTSSETTTPQQQKFSLAHFWNRHLFTAPPPQQLLPASPSSSPPTPEPNRPTSAPPGVIQNNNNNNTSNNASPKSSHSPHPRHPQRSASSSSSSSSYSTSSESRSSSSTSVSDSGPTISGPTLSASPTTTSTSLSHLVLGTISKRSSRGLTLPFTSSTNNNKSPSLASAPAPLTTTTTNTNGSPTTASPSSGGKVPLARSQSHSAVMVKRTSPSLVESSSVWQQQQHQQGVHGGRRGRDDQEIEEQQREEASEQGQQQQQQQKQQQQHDLDLGQPTYLSTKKRVASGQAQLDHYRNMIQQLDAQSGAFVSQQQELRERRDHVARAVESLENVLHRPWQTTTTSTSSIATKNHRASRPTSMIVDSSEQAKQALAAKLGRRRSLPNNANHAGEGGGGGRTGKEEGGGERGGRGLFVFTQPSLWSIAHAPSAKAVVLHSHDVGDTEKDDTDDMFVHPPESNKRSTVAPGSLATLSPSASSPNSNAHRSRDDPLFKADCERCILKEELLQKRCALQQLQCEIERVQQRLNSCASQVRMIQRTFVGPIEQHLATDQSELWRLERAIKN